MAWKNLFTFWHPANGQAVEKDNLSQINMLIGITYTYMVVLAAYFVWNLVENIDNTITIAQIISLVSLLFCLKYARAYRFAAALFLALCLFHFNLLVLSFAEFPYTIMFWSPIFVIAAVYLLGPAWGAVWSFCSFLICAGVLHWSTAFRVPVNVVDPTTHKTLATYAQALTMVAAYAGSVIFSRHISRLHRDLQEQHAKLQDLLTTTQQQKAEIQSLVSIVCHDIANPLSVIIAYVSLLKKNELSESQRKGIDRIDKAGTTIGTIIDSVREFHKIETGKVSLDLQPVDLMEVLAQLQVMFQERLDAKNLTLNFEPSSDGKFEVLANENALLHNVLSNLVSNAIKFSDRGSKIVIALAVKGECVDIVVRDFGIGIPANILNNLFRMDKTTSRPGTAGERGTGFGMPIVKSVVEKIGGTIEVHSRTREDSDDPGVITGTTFVVQLRKSVV